MSTLPQSLDDRGGGAFAAVFWAVVLFVVTGLLYPFIATSLGGALFGAQARGSLVEAPTGMAVGSALIAQPFANDGYLEPRPSAIGYDPRSTGGSNWAPSNPALRERMVVDSARIAAREQVAPETIPVELLSTSGAGLDPHLTPAGALFQAPRVARSRGVAVGEVEALIRAAVEPPMFGLWGGERVNVLLVNLALDRQFGAPPAGSAMPAP